jgi:ribosomal-protein-alanine N-acetyltransferase
VDVPTITTERLTLRPFVEQDADPLYHILAQEGVLCYFPNPEPPPPDRIERFVSHQIKHWEDHGFGWWAVELRTEQKLIGWNGLQYLPETDEIEIGYLLNRDYWGRGLATEGARPGLRFGFETLGLERIIALTHPENVASQRVIAKLGMAFTNEADYFGMHVCRFEIDADTYAQMEKRASGQKETGV